MPRKKDNRDTMLQQIDGQIYMLNIVMQQLLASPKGAELYVQQRLSDLQQARNKIYAQQWEDSMKAVETATSKYVQQELVSEAPVGKEAHTSVPPKKK